MPAAEKKFVLTHVVEDVLNMKEDEYRYSNAEEHFNVTWQMYAVRKDKLFGLFLRCDNQTKNKWSVTTRCTLSLLAMNGKLKSNTDYFCFEHSSRKNYDHGVSNLISWEEMQYFYVVDGNVIIEAHVEILKMTGIEKKKLRNFDESMKEFSDVVLNVGDEKFHVLKLYLAAHSTYFEALFLRKFEESEKSEITLKDVDPKNFQTFLELLYGESPIDDDTVERILKLGDMYDVKLAIRKCEDFLINQSEKTLKEKLQMAKKYHLKKLQNDCLSKINTADEIRSVLSFDTSEMDPTVVRAIIQKSLLLVP